MAGVLQRLLRARRGAVALLFGLSAVPLTMFVGLAIDYSFYIQVKAQVGLAADAAAMHAVSVASRAYTGQTSASAAQQAGEAAGQQWFAAQMGALTNGTVAPGNITVNVTHTTAPSGFTAAVAYSGRVATHFGALFKTASWPVSGSANAVVSSSYVEVLMLLDASSSMLIGASLSDIVAMEQATPCSKQSATAPRSMDSYYSWKYTGNYGYGPNNNQPPTLQNGVCDPKYIGDTSACTYATTFANVSPTNPFQCTNGGGASQNIKGTTYPNMPQAPCAFACHSDKKNKDYYSLARSLTKLDGNPVQLRLDVVQDAAAAVIATLQRNTTTSNLFSVGLYRFDSALTQAYPNSGEAGTDLATAESIATALKDSPPYTPVGIGDTDFTNAAQSLNNVVSAAGDGATATTPLKNLFIVTDGAGDISGNFKPFTDPSNEKLCSLFWAKGFNVYVLYTPYLPLPSPIYFSTIQPSAEPTASSPDIAALQACARYPENFFQASDPAAINTAMQNMLAKAINAPGRVAN